jgi:hypothetical protein
MRRFARRVDRIAEGGLSRRDLDLLARYQASWHAAIASTSAPLRRKLTTCRRLERQVQAFYVIGYTPAEYGKDGWVEFGVRNNSGRTIWLSNNGTAWSRGAWPAYEHDWDKARKAARHSWGGSSSDPALRVAPYSEQRARAATGVTFPYVPMRASGAIIAAEPVMDVSYEIGPDIWCRVPAERR